MLSTSHWTLRAKLVASVLALFTVVMLGTGLATVLAAREFTNRQLITDLESVAGRVDRERGEVERHDQDDGPRERPVPMPGNAGNVLVLGLRGGAVATDRAGRPLNRVVNLSNETDTLDAAQVATLRAAGLSDRPKRVEIGGDVGHYLLVARSFDNGLTLVTGVPTDGSDRAVAALTAIIGTGTLAGIALVGLGASWLVRRTLEPLDRVAATAEQVSALELHSGDVALAERVPHTDTDSTTEVGKVGLALNRMLDNVEDALKARQESETRVRQFVADASHELRTPLASIRGYAELSKREQEPVPAGVRHALGRVESEALRMQGLVEDLLLLARLDSGRPLARETVDLSLLAMDIVSDAHAAAPDHVWELDLPDEPVEVMGDGARLHQLVANLLANARVHTPAGTRVVVRVREQGDTVRLSVTDDGPGIPEALQPNVFERFSRGDDSRNRASGSTGLGLSIVAAVSAAHGGRVELTSAPGNTVFSVLLPR